MDIRLPKTNLNELSEAIHEYNVHAGWWPKDKETRNKAEILCLIHSEISEAMEGLRKDLMDDKLPHRKMVEVELADALIRIFDMAGAFGYDLNGAMQEKFLYNKTRSDHKLENRAKDGGKKF